MKKDSYLCGKSYRNPATKDMAELGKWQWQEPGTAWRGVKRAFEIAAAGEHNLMKLFNNNFALCYCKWEKCNISELHIVPDPACTIT